MNKTRSNTVSYWLRKQFIIGAAVILLLPLQAFALGLGSLEIQSNLDQALDGFIELRTNSGDDLSSLRARIASREEFEELDINYPSYIGGIRLSLEQRDNRPVLRIISDSAINEPFVHLLIRVDWSGGSFLREYTALIDPPVYAASTPPTVSQPRVIEEIPSYDNRSANELGSVYTQTEQS